MERRCCTVVQKSLKCQVEMFWIFFSETAPCGVIGSFLEDKTNNIPDHFAFKHHYITSAMDSEVLCMILKAIHEKRNITIEIINRKKDRITETNVGI